MYYRQSKYVLRYYNNVSLYTGQSSSYMNNNTYNVTWMHAHANCSIVPLDCEEIINYAH